MVVVAASKVSLCLVGSLDSKLALCDESPGVVFLGSSRRGGGLGAETGLVSVVRRQAGCEVGKSWFCEKAGCAPQKVLGRFCERRIRAISERREAWTVGSSASWGRRKGCGRRAGRVSAAATVVTESRVITDEAVGIASAVEEAMALARAAAKAARAAAAAYAEEAHAISDSFQAFPSQHDLLLLERARLTEMARLGAIQISDFGEVFSPETENAGLPRDLDSESQLNSILERGKSRQPHWKEGTDGSPRLRETDRVAVKSSRRKERILKRERVLTRAGEVAAAVATTTPRAKKAQSYESVDAVRAYLPDIGRTKLLTIAEEVGLAEGIQDLLRMEGVKADLVEQMGREPSLIEWARAVGTEHHLMESRIKSGQACKDKMVNANLRLVVSIAKKYQGRGMTIQDLIQEGSLGLIRGAEKFDHTRGFKFSTYAHWWIRQAITRAIADQSRTIRLPVHVYELLSRINKAKSMLAAEHGRAPRDEDVAELVGLNVEKLKMVIKSTRSPRSMEFPIGKNNDTTLGEIVADHSTESPEEAISKRLLKQDLDFVLKTLNPRERDVLRMRYGLDDGKARTLEEIGNAYKLTRERIRQIEVKALRKLRQPSRNTTLREYLLDMKS